MGLDSSKSVSLDKARLLFPTAELDRKKDHNRAEALLLAEYSRRLFAGGRETAQGLRVETQLENAAAAS